MAAAWLLLILAVTVGNLALGFGLACLFGHGPRLPTLVLPSFDQVMTTLFSLPPKVIEFIRSRRSPQSPP